MADRAKKISELTATTSVANSDLFVVVANAAGNAVTKSITTGYLMLALNELVAAPANATSTGTAGQLAFDSSHIYYCVANNVWKRATLSTW